MIVTKTAAIVKDVSDEDSGTGEFEVVLSAATLDRDGEVIDSRAFDPLPDHIPFDIDHGMTVTTTVGSGTPSYNDAGQLIVKGTYASTALAQEVRTLVREGHVRTTSVTFMAATREEKDGVPHVTKAELLNGTFTPIPSNREAVVLSGKSLAAVTDEKVGARNSAKDAEAIQAAHDSLVTLGAACSKACNHGEEKTVESPGDDDDTPTSDTEQSADDAASESAAQAADSDAADSADEGSESNAPDWDALRKQALAARDA